MFRCKMCGKRTLDKSQMKRHMILFHEYQSTDISMYDLVTTEEAPDHFSTTSDSSGSSFDSGGGSFGGGGASGSWD